VATLDRKLKGPSVELSLAVELKPGLKDIKVDRLFSSKLDTLFLLIGFSGICSLFLGISTFWAKAANFSTCIVSSMSLESGEILTIIVVFESPLKYLCKTQVNFESLKKGIKFKLVS